VLSRAVEQHEMTLETDYLVKPIVDQFSKAFRER
jgi:hypothetical protein